MRKISYSLIAGSFVLVGVASVPSMPAKENLATSVQCAELCRCDWKRTPMMSTQPCKRRALIWLGVVREVSVSHKDGKVEIECSVNNYPLSRRLAAILGPSHQKAEKERSLALLLILNDMSMTA